jgi:tetratricopeptide (TPR) repeat protein
MLPPDLNDVQRAIGRRYEILDLAGAGGMGAVYRARHRELGHIVAVKVLPPEIAASEMRRQRFRREAQLGASLAHPHIVPVYEFDTRGGITFLIMPFVRGETLETLLAHHSRLDLGGVLRIVREIGDALDTAHRRGIVHRDVKPSNILIEEDSGRAMLTDWGVAFVEGVTTLGFTAPGTAIGTPLYMSPEQAAGTVDRRSDIYSLALVAIEALAGRRPEPGSDPAALARELRLLPTIAAPLAAALVAPLAARPDDRPASAQAWRVVIDRSRTRGWRRRAVGAGALVVAAALARFLWWPPLPPPCPADAACLIVPPAEVSGTGAVSAEKLTTSTAWHLGSVRRVRVTSPDPVWDRALQLHGRRALTNQEAAALANDFGAKYFLQLHGAFTERAVTLTATLYQADNEKVRGEAVETGPIDSLTAVMETILPKVLGRVRSDGAQPSNKRNQPRRLRAWDANLSAFDAFSRGDYETALDEWDRVIRLEPGFAPAYFHRALAQVQIAPTEEVFRPALDSALKYRAGLLWADSLLLAGYRELLDRGDGVAAMERFKLAADSAPDDPLVWFVLGEFYFHFGPFFDQSWDEAERAFDKVLALDAHFAPAIAHLITFADVRGETQLTKRRIGDYLRRDSTSTAAEVVGIVDTMRFGSLGDRARVVHALDRRKLRVLEIVAFVVAQRGKPEERRGPGRRLLNALERRAATDSERARALRIGVAADLRERWLDSARARLDRATSSATVQERDAWIVLAHAARVGALGDWRGAARRVDARLGAGGRPAPVPHWLLARAGIDRRRHAGALARLAADSAPLSTSLHLDLVAMDALARGDTARALSAWAAATRRYAVFSMPFGLVASLWPLRLDMVRVAVASGDSATAGRACTSFEDLMGAADQAALPEITRLCHGASPTTAP